MALAVWIYGATYRRDIEVDIGVTKIEPLWRQLSAWPTDADAILGVTIVWNPGVTNIGLASDVRFTIPSSDRVELDPIYDDPYGQWRVCVVRAELAMTDCADACGMTEAWLEHLRQLGFSEDGAPVRARPRCGCEAASCVEDLDTRRGDLRVRFQVIAHPGSDGLPDECRVELALGDVGYDHCRATFVDHYVPNTYRRFGVDSFWSR